MFTYTAADGDDNTDADDEATLTFTITVTRPPVTVPQVTGGGMSVMTVLGGVTATTTITVESTAPATVRDNPTSVVIRELTLPVLGATATTQTVDITLSEPGPEVRLPGGFTIAAAGATDAEVRANIVEITVEVDRRPLNP